MYLVNIDHLEYLLFHFGPRLNALSHKVMKQQQKILETIITLCFTNNNKNRYGTSQTIIQIFLVPAKLVLVLYAIKICP